MLHRLIPAAIFAIALSLGTGPEKAEHQSTSVTYWKDIRPLISAACLPCHAEGGPGSVRLDNYISAKRNALLMAVLTGGGEMPLGGVESDCTDAYPTRLSGKSVLLLKEWAATGALEGPAPIAVIEDIAPEQSYTRVHLPTITIPAAGEPTWLSVESVLDRPMNLGSLALPLRTGALIRAVSLEVLRADSASWVTRSHLTNLPTKNAHKLIELKPGDRLRWNLRVFPSGEEVDVEPTVRMYATAAKSTPIQWLILAPRLSLQAGEAKRVTATAKVDRSARLRRIIPPEAKWIRSAEVSARIAGRGRVVLARYRPFRSNSAGVVKFDPGLLLPRGTVVELVLDLDNSTANQSLGNRPREKVSLDGASREVNLQFRVGIAESGA